jgi:methyl-accepting chemotaxis protein
VRLTVRNKLFAEAIVFAALLLVLGLFALSKMASINASARYVGDKSVPSVLAIGSIRGTLKDYRNDQLQYVVAEKESEKKELVKSMKRFEVAMDKLFKSYEPLLADSKDRSLWKAAEIWWRDYQQNSSGVLVFGGAFTLTGGVKTNYDGLVKATDEWITYNTRVAHARVQSSQAAFSSSKTLFLALLVLGTLAGLAIAFVIARGITRGVAQMLVASRGIAEGDVDQEVSLTSRDELGETASAFRSMIAYLKGMAASAETIADGDLTVEVEPKSERDALGNAFAKMVTNLRGIVAEVTQAAGSMTSASQQMATTSEEAGRAVGEIAGAVSVVAHGADRQVRVVNEARTSTETTSESAEQARELARQGVEAAGRADEAMRSVRDSAGAVSATINELAAKSDQIGGIVDTITGIAGQTNLLALNAAIEAARAGEQGRGFAVVAEEVRKLAEESQRAAQTIAGLIADIQSETARAVDVVEEGARRTEDGVETVAFARQAFEAIGTAVEEMRARIAQIVEATAEVASVAEQTSASTEEVSASTEQTSASTQEIAASAQELARTAEELDKLVGFFRVEEAA